MATWYFQDGANSMWSNLSNWFDQDGGVGNNPTVAPWTDASTAADILVQSSLMTNPPTIDVEIGSSDSSWAITGTCDIGAINAYNTIYDGTYTGDHFWNNGTIDGGTFTGGDFSGDGTINGGTFTGDTSSDGNNINGGTFTSSSRLVFGNINGGTWDVTTLYAYGSDCSINYLPSTTTVTFGSNSINVPTCYATVILNPQYNGFDMSGEFFGLVTFTSGISGTLRGTYHQDLDMSYLPSDQPFNFQLSGTFLGRVISAAVGSSLSGIFYGDVSAQVQTYGGNPTGVGFYGTFYGNISELGQSSWGGATVYGNVYSYCGLCYSDTIGSNDSIFYGDVQMRGGGGPYFGQNYIGSGTYYGSVSTDETCWIAGGTFYGSVASGTYIYGGDFYGSVGWGGPNFVLWIPGGFLSGTVHNLTSTVAGGKVTTSFGGVTQISKQLTQLDVLGTGGL